MSIAATASGSCQVSEDQWRDWNRTRVFPDSVTFTELTAWARTVLGPNADWESLLLSKIQQTDDKEQS